MIIDTHSHLNFKAYDADRKEVISRIQEGGIVCIDVGTKYETSKKAVELAQEYNNIYAVIGMHPIHIKQDLLKFKTDEEEGAFGPLGEEYDVDRYRQLIIEDRRAEGPERSRRIVAIGEIGLDYYYRPKTKSKQEQFKQKQKEVFVKQLDLAKELNLPVIFHCRMAHADTAEILKNYPGLHGVMHCFTGTIDEMKNYLKMGFYLGFNGIVFKLPLDEAIKQCPLDRILLETDCPYLTPPVEGKDKRNEPIFVKHIAQRIAELKNITFDQVVSQTTTNAKKLFKI